MSLNKTHKVLHRMELITRTIGEKLGWTKAEMTIPMITPVPVAKAQELFEAKFGIEAGSCALEITADLPDATLGQCRHGGNGKSTIALRKGIDMDPRAFHVVLAHELGHLVLARAGIGLDSGINDRELMADLCVVLVGLGSDQLNMNIHDKPCSYLETEEMAAAYVISVTMRAHKPDLSRLSTPAADGVRKVMEQHPELCDGRLHDEALFAAMVNRGMAQVVALRTPQHDPTSALCALENRVRERAKTTDPALRFLQALLVLEQVEDLLLWTFDLRAA